ncbi:MAG TPA: apolipoprotein N-acyltransferase, partial [Actinomycetota bacterium]|nr:apolipoprotein N-acyltransferase [Actinomycetota bacterium]
GSFPLGGFAWGQLGASQVGSPMLPLASTTGVWGLSFVVLLIAALLLHALERWGRGARVAALAAVGATGILLLSPAVIPVPTPNGRAIDVAAIQVDVESVQHLGGSAEDVAVALLNADLHRSLAADPPDLAVWGEGALDPGATEDPATFATVSDVIADVGAPTLAGAVVNLPDGTQRTSTLAFDGSGRVIDRYDKVRLVPFGEYVPWRGFLERFIRAVDQVPVDRTPGERVHDLTLPGLPPIGTPICYENSYPRIERRMVRQGAGFLIVTINNASYERTAASEQHLQMSRLRAVENGRWVVHAAVSGISAFVDPRGAVVDRRGLFEPAVMRREIRASTRTTLFTRLGDWVPWGSLTIVLGLLMVPRGRSRDRGAPPPLGEEPRILVVLPTYEEKDTIGAVLDGLLALPHRIEILVVDDGSPDGTGRVVAQRAEADARIRLVERERKSGLASAYGLGFATALREGHDLIVEMDSDLSHDPAELPRLLETARRHDVVIGSRYVQGGSVTNWSRGRLALSRAGNRYARLALGFHLHDATSGFRVYRRDALARITARPLTSEGYGFQIELAYRAWTAGLAVGEAPITFREREHGTSKISRRIVLEALWLITRWGLRARLRASVHA